ncbi:MAG: hypothetical protein ACE5KT_06980 [Methanosarcinales archaeon]
MTYKLLFILLEGNDDERFFEKVVKPLFQKRSCTIRFWKYSQQKHERIVNLIKSIKSMNGDYIYVRDFNNAPCITAKKEEIKSKFNQIITEDKIIVVVKEIESWYLAGLDERALKKVGIRKKIRTTANITKKEFNQLIPKNMPRIEFMHEILENYNVETAKRRNKSFKYFLNKWINDSNGV